MNTCLPEIRREKVFIPPEMTPKEIKEKYGLSSSRYPPPSCTKIIEGSQS